MLLFHRLWLLQRQLTYGQERHTSKKPWCAVAAMMPCVNCLSQKVHVLSAARQVLRINYTSILWIGLVHSTAYWQDHVAKCKGTLQCLFLTLLIDRELWFLLQWPPPGGKVGLPVKASVLCAHGVQPALKSASYAQWSALNSLLQQCSVCLPVHDAHMEVTVM